MALGQDIFPWAMERILCSACIRCLSASARFVAAL